VSARQAQIDALVADAEAGLPLGISEAFETARFDAADARAAADRIRARADASSLHLLLALRREAPDVYRELSPQVRAAVLVDALREVPQLNDFGWMEPGGDGQDRTAARALLELGDAAREPLAALLDDDRPAPLAGSEAATMSHLYGYRRSDFAYRYLARLMGRDPSCAADPGDRDGAIRALRDELRRSAQRG
jgi:hypothetical protein